MALSSTVLEGLIIAELNSLGIVTTGEHARAQLMAKAVATAVVAHIKAAAIVQTNSGAPDGEHTGTIS
ncbi:MAG: hypothetical protein Q8M66_06620 [Actinomycetota bacterium]|nr:hypothetical protein [Actinomycetota bacterium]